MLIVLRLSKKESLKSVKFRVAFVRSELRKSESVKSA
jgi:hypothetical protein